MIRKKWIMHPLLFKKKIENRRIIKMNKKKHDKTLYFSYFDFIRHFCSLLHEKMKKICKMYQEEIHIIFYNNYDNFSRIFQLEEVVLNDRKEKKIK